MEYSQQPCSSNAYHARASLIDHDYDLDSFLAEMKRNITAPPTSSEDDEEDESDAPSDGENEEQKQKCKKVLQM